MKILSYILYFIIAVITKPIESVATLSLYSNTSISPLKIEWFERYFIYQDFLSQRLQIKYIFKDVPDDLRYDIFLTKEINKRYEQVYQINDIIRNISIDQIINITYERYCDVILNCVENNVNIDFLLENKLVKYKDNLYDFLTEKEFKSLK